MNLVSTQGDAKALAAIRADPSQQPPGDEASVAAAAHHRARRRRLLVNVARLAVLVVIVGGWQLFTEWKIVDPFFFGQPSGIVLKLKDWVENGTAYIHKLAHRESAKPLSAGTTLSAALFERVIDVDNVDLVDFGTGNDAYKSDWMEVDRQRFRIDCLDPKQPRAWPALAKRLLARKPSAR